MIKRKQLDGGPEWMDIKSAQEYANVSERTLREWIHRPVNPLPAAQVDHGKILIKRGNLDQWLEAHPVQSINAIDVNLIADKILNDLKKVA
jgi:excisionase family DNA binding protein